MNFGERFKLLRKEKELTQAEIANIFSLGESTISFYESNKRTPDYGLLQKIADFFNVTTDYLLGRTDERNPQIKEDRFLNREETQDFAKEIMQMFVDAGEIESLDAELTQEQRQKILRIVDHAIKINKA